MQPRPLTTRPRHTPPSEAPRFAVLEALIFSFVLATLHTVIFRYRYGVDTQVETISALLRSLDPAYLQNDFFVNASAQFGARTHYVQMLAALCHFMSIPNTVFLLTWLSHLLVAFATCLAARQLFPDSRPTQLLSATLVLSIQSITISGLCFLHVRALVPFFFALPWTLLSLRFALAGRPLACLAMAGAASLAHPAGVQIGLIGLIASAAPAVCGLLRADGNSRAGRARELATTAASCVVLLTLAYLLWIRPYSVEIPAEQLRDIFACFRTPHHSVPSAFGALPWFMLIAFLAAMAFAGLSWVREDPVRRDEQMRMATCVAIILIICAVGYVGVELVPIRFVVVASPFRLLGIVKWFGLMLIAQFAVRNLRAPLSTGKPVLGAATLLATGPYQPLFVLATPALNAVRAWFAARGLATAADFVAWLGGSTALAFALFFRNDEEFHALLVFAAVTAWFLFVRPRSIRVAAPLLGCAALAFIFYFAKMHPQSAIARIVQSHQPILTLADDPDEAYRLGILAKEKTPDDAEFIVPPSGLRFRLTAQRAVVVDYKAFPFNDRAILEWFDRIQFCYGGANGVYSNALERLETSYRAITDQQLSAIRDRYSASYAVLYSSTPTGFPVLFATEHFKVVSLDKP